MCSEGNEPAGSSRNRDERLAETPEARGWERGAARARLQGAARPGTGLTLGGAQGQAVPGERASNSGLPWMENPIYRSGQPVLQLRSNPLTLIWEANSELLGGSQLGWGSSERFGCRPLGRRLASADPLRRTIVPVLQESRS